jgi:hypothetical protein
LLPYSGIFAKHVSTFHTISGFLGFFLPFGVWPIVLPYMGLGVVSFFRLVPSASKMVLKWFLSLFFASMFFVSLPMTLLLAQIGGLYAFLFLVLASVPIACLSGVSVAYAFLFWVPSRLWSGSFYRWLRSILLGYDLLLDFCCQGVAGAGVVLESTCFGVLGLLKLSIARSSTVSSLEGFRFLTGIFVMVAVVIGDFGLVLLSLSLVSPILICLFYPCVTVVYSFLQLARLPVLSPEFWCLFLLGGFILFGMVIALAISLLKTWGRWYVRFPLRIIYGLGLYSLIVSIPLDTFVPLRVTWASFKPFVTFNNVGVTLRFLVGNLAVFWLECRRFVRLFFFSSVFGLNYLTPFDPEIASTDLYLEREGKLLSFLHRGWVSIGRRYAFQLVKKLDDLRIPEFIQSSYKPPSLESVRSTYRDLQAFGLPISQNFIDSLDRPEKSDYLRQWGGFRQKIFGTSNFALGFSNVKTAAHTWLADGLDFMSHIPGYIHTTSFTGVAEEIASTSRYWGFNDAHVEDTDALIDDCWELVKAQYANSKLTTFWTIFKSWRKRFNMGFGFGTRTASGKLKQYTRQQVIDMMGGGKNFIQIMKKIYKKSLSMHMLSPVFTKWESLKLKKALLRSVRTVVGSAFSEYLGNTVFNLAPNHNYKVWDTPMKVGMSINGISYNRLWHSISHHTAVWAGDMTAFDSSQAPVVLRIVAGIRKKGFRFHRDSAKICQYIDLAYENLISQPLGFKNFGDLAFKDKGATTGHSSTSSDNSLMLVINYMFAWRFVTGLRAREFLVYNTLANFGDDHVLGYEPVFGWCPNSMVLAMAKLGTIMRDESPGQNYLPSVNAPLPHGIKEWRLAHFAFLSKKPLPLDLATLTELRVAGVDTSNLSFATCHDPERLKGKLAGAALLSQVNDPLRSYQALLSYIDLCSHHKDLYDQLVVRAHAFRRKHLNYFIANSVPVKNYPLPPTYNQVLRKWYNDKSSFAKNDDSLEPEDQPDVIRLVADESLLRFVHWVADIPTLIVPRFGVLPWVDRLQGALGSRLAWPLLLVGAAAGHPRDIGPIKSMISRTPYAFLRSDLLQFPVDSPSLGTLYLRHWVFTLVSNSWSRSRRWSMFDWLRLFESSFVQLVWILTAQVCHVVYDLDMHLYESLLVVLCSYIESPVDFSFPLMEPFAPSNLFGVSLSYIVRLFATPSGDLQSFRALASRLQFNPDRVVVTAPTGTGKSTRLMVELMQYSQRRVIAILPRRILVLSIVPYMQTTYPDLVIAGSTEGMEYDSSARLIYCTAQSFWARPDLRTAGSVFVLDEAHIYEPSYLLITRWLLEGCHRSLFVTATPPDSLCDLETVTVPIVSAFSTHQVNNPVATVSAYYRYVVSFVNDRSPSERVLVFVSNKEAIQRLASQIRHRCCGLSSDSVWVDPDATVFISTNVADAGLTIPDVNFVFSLNTDVAFRVKETYDKRNVTNLVERNVSTEHLFDRYTVPLSSQTIKQRKGRTGRTCDGVFFFCSLPTSMFTSLSTPKFGLFDFVTSVGPGVKYVKPFLPRDLVATADPDGLEIFIQAVSEIPGLNYSHYYNGIQTYKIFKAKYTIPQWVDKLRNEKIFDEWKLMRSNPVIDPDLIDFEMDLPKSLVDNPLGFKFEPQSLEPLTPISPTEKVRPSPPEQQHSRVGVSGVGLLCGARCLQGLVYTHLGVYVELVEIVDQLRSSQYVALGVEQRNDNFDVGQLKDIAESSFGFAMSVSARGVVSPPGSSNTGTIPCLIYHSGSLGGGHYNYHGVPIPTGVDPVPISEVVTNVGAVGDPSLLRSDPFDPFGVDPPVSSEIHPIEDDLLGLF